MKSIIDSRRAEQLVSRTSDLPGRIQQLSPSLRVMRPESLPQIDALRTAPLSAAAGGMRSVRTRNGPRAELFQRCRLKREPAQSISVTALFARTVRRYWADSARRPARL